MATAKLYAIWAAIGPLVGVVIGAWLAARWQDRRWILDNKKAEYRGILDALQTYRWNVTRHRARCGATSISPDAAGEMGEDQLALAEALHSLWSALADRIFIREALVNSGVHQDLQSLHRSLVSDNPPDMAQWQQKCYDLHLKLLRTAWKDLRLGKHIPWSATIPSLPREE
jgi:hypothetical protein